jgi:hypothetical protein
MGAAVGATLNEDAQIHKHTLRKVKNPVTRE